MKISICKKCGFVFQNPRFTEDDWNKYYETDYDLFHRPFSNHSIDVGHDKAALEIYERLSKYLDFKNVNSITDIGAGSGSILNTLGKVTGIHNLFSIEPSASCQVDLAKKNIKLIGDSFLNISYEYSGTADLLIMRQVLEHIYSPQVIMKMLYKLLITDGILYVSVPYLMGYGKNILECFSFPHISYFNKYTLERLFVESGLDIIATGIVGDEIYSVLKKTSKTVEKVTKEDGGENFKSTYEYLIKNNDMKTFLKRRIKTGISYLIPESLLRKYILRKRNVSY